MVSVPCYNDVPVEVLTAGQAVVGPGRRLALLAPTLQQLNLLNSGVPLKVCGCLTGPPGRRKHRDSIASRCFALWQVVSYPRFTQTQTTIRQLGLASKHTGKIVLDTEHCCVRRHSDPMASKQTGKIVLDTEHCCVRRHPDPMCQSDQPYNRPGFGTMCWVMKVCVRDGRLRPGTNTEPYVHDHTQEKYSGTCIERTPLGAAKNVPRLQVACYERHGSVAGTTGVEVTATGYHEQVIISTQYNTRMNVDLQLQRSLSADPQPLA